MAIVRQKTETVTSKNHPPLLRQHTEPERPEVCEPPDLLGRKHVEKVAGEYRVREDECFAERLQNEEFDLHFGKNKDDRHRGHIDIKKAKEIYLREIEESGLVSQDELKHLCKDDKFLAEEVQRRLAEESDVESQGKAASEMQDEEFARYLEEREKDKLELQRKHRLQRRIAQDRAAAERFQEEELQRGVSNIEITTSDQKEGWSVDCEVGTSNVLKTREELQHLKDAEMARSLHLQEAELEMQCVEEERDRQIALKLQRTEAEEYRTAKREREQRHQERQSRHSSNDDEECTDNRRRKQLQSVDATGKAIESGGQPSIDSPHRQGSHNDRNRTDGNTPHRDGSHQERQRMDSNTPGRQLSRHSQRTVESYNEEGTPNQRSAHKEAIYLQAVDATGVPVEQSRNNSIKRQEEEDILQAQQERYEQFQRERPSKSHTPRLIDEQYALQQQMRHVNNIQNGIQVEQSKHYDVAENVHYTNVATNIDPTYSSIDSLRHQNKRIESLSDEDGNPISVPVIQNVKRGTHGEEGSKKKKKWFSKKEKHK